MNGIARQQSLETAKFRTPKDARRVVEVIRNHVARLQIDVTAPVLVVGGGGEDLEILTSCGFTNIVLSNLHGGHEHLDAEDLALPDNSYPVVFAHAVLHHCRCPHKAIGEMLRVAENHVLFVEPNDSFVLRTLVRLGFSFPYELAAVIDNGYTAGGMRNGPIPNYIFRWTERDVRQALSSYHPELQFAVVAHPYWDFYVNENDLLVRHGTALPALARAVGPGNLIRVLHVLQLLANILPPVRREGNKFFCGISKRGIQPWLEKSDSGLRMKRVSDMP